MGNHCLGFGYLRAIVCRRRNHRDYFWYRSHERLQRSRDPKKRRYKNIIPSKYKW